MKIYTVNKSKPYDLTIARENGYLKSSITQTQNRKSLEYILRQVKDVDDPKARYILGYVNSRLRSLGFITGEEANSTYNGISVASVSLLPTSYVQPSPVVIPIFTVAIPNLLVKFEPRRSSEISITPPKLVKPENCGGDREIFVDDLESATFKIEYWDEAAIEKFRALSADLLPILPYGYQWSISPEATTSWCIYKASNIDEHDLKLVLYGPDEKGHIDYLFIVDGVTQQSFAYTQPEKTDPFLEKRSSPIKKGGYIVGEYNYAGYRFSTHVRGHCIDQRDTITFGPSAYFSASDKRNFIPEPPDGYWGLHMRNPIVKRLRANAGAYAQLASYPEEDAVGTSKPKLLRTTDGTYVPEHVYLYCMDASYERDHVYSIDWSIHYAENKGKQNVFTYAERYTTMPSDAPIVVPYDPIAPDRTQRLAVRNLRKEYQEILKRHSFAYDRNAFFRQKAAADKEFVSPYSKFDTALRACEQEKSKTAKTSLVRAEKQALELLELDDKRLLISYSQREGLKKKSGFFGEEHEDIVRKIDGDQRKPEGPTREWS